MKTFARILLVLLIPGILLLPKVFADGATLSLSPSSGSYNVGSSITVNVMVGSGGSAINAAQGTINFPSDLLSVSSVSKGSSIFSLWTSEPSYDNGAGTVSFSGGSPSPFSKPTGNVISVTFHAKAAGTANLTFGSDAQVLAADGQGTNVLSGTGKASFTIASAASAPAPAPEPAPSADPGSGDSGNNVVVASVDVKITSPTHPDQNKWYNNKNPQFQWKLDDNISGVGLDFNQKATANPAKSSDGLFDSKTYSNVDDGVWYLHARFKDISGNWSATMHYKVQIDTVQPDSFTASVSNSNNEWIASFATKDGGSGIDHYALKIDGGDPVNVGPDQLKDGTYPLPPTLPGDHTLLVTAYDKAGNSRDASTKFTMAGFNQAKITDAPTTLTVGEPLVVEGVANPKSLVSLLIKQGDKEVTTLTGTADDGGHWIVAKRQGLDRGTYSIAVKMKTVDGAESPLSDAQAVYVSWPPFISEYGWIVVAALLLVIIGLLAVIVYEKKIYHEKKSQFFRKLEESRTKVKAIFDALHEETEEKVTLTDERSAKRAHADRLHPTEVIEKLNDAYALSEEEIGKEFDDIEQIIK